MVSGVTCNYLTLELIFHLLLIHTHTHTPFHWSWLATPPFITHQPLDPGCRMQTLVRGTTADGNFPFFTFFLSKYPARKGFNTQTSIEYFASQPYTLINSTSSNYFLHQQKKKQSNTIYTIKKHTLKGYDASVTLQ